MNSPTGPRRHPDAVYKLVDGEALIVVPGTDAEHLVLNEVGARVWELLDGEHDLAMIRSALTDEFQVDGEQAERDVAELIEQLGEHGALADSAPPERAS